MCMTCGCCTPNDKKIGPQNFGSNGGSGKSVVVPPTDASSDGALI
jgi:hypothetical protein